MRTSIIFLTLLVIASLSLVAQDRATDEQAVREAVLAVPTALNARDWAATAAPFAEDGDLMLPGGPLLSGREAISAYWQQVWTKAPPDRQIALTIRSLRFLGPHAAIVDATAEFSAGEPARDRATYVISRRGNQWQVAGLRVMPAEAGAAAAQAAADDPYAVRDSQLPVELRQAMRARDESLSQADAATWDRLTADSFTVVREDGRLLTKAERLAELKGQQPQPFVAPRDGQVTRFGDTVIRRFRAGDLWVLDVWVREQGLWRVAAVQLTSAPAAPQEAQSSLRRPGAHTPPDVLAAVAPAAEAEGQPDNLLATFRRFHVHSRTIYMRPARLLEQLRARPEYSAWALTPVEERASAELLIEIDRPALTFDWTYKVIDPRTGQPLLSGKCVAWDDRRAAPRLATMIVENIGAARGGTVPAASAAQATSPPGSNTGVKPLLKPRTWNGFAVGQEGQQDVQLHVAPNRVWGTRKLDSNLQSGGHAFGLGIGSPGWPREREEVLFSVSPDQILDIAYVVGRRGDAVMDLWAGAWETAGALAGGSSSEAASYVTLGTMVLATIGSGIILATGGESKLMLVFRGPDGQLRSFMFGLSVGSRPRPLLAALQSVSSRTPRDVMAEMRSLRRRLAASVDSSIPVVTDRSVQLGWVELPAGRYYLLFQERDREWAELFVFRHGTHPESSAPVAQAIVELGKPIRAGDEGGASGEAVVTYVIDNGIQIIKAIETGDLAIHFSAIPVSLETAGPRSRN